MSPLSHASLSLSFARARSPASATPLLSYPLFSTHPPATYPSRTLPPREKRKNVVSSRTVAVLRSSIDDVKAKRRKGWQTVGVACRGSSSTFSTTSLSPPRLLQLPLSLLAHRRCFRPSLFLSLSLSLTPPRSAVDSPTFSATPPLAWASGVSGRVGSEGLKYGRGSGIVCLR